MSPLGDVAQGHGMPNEAACATMRMCLHVITAWWLHYPRKIKWITFDYVVTSWVLKYKHRCKEFICHHSAKLPKKTECIVNKQAQWCECLCVSQQFRDYITDARSNATQPMSLTCRECSNLNIAATTAMCAKENAYRCKSAATSLWCCAASRDASSISMGNANNAFACAKSLSGLHICNAWSKSG